MKSADYFPSNLDKKHKHIAYEFLLVFHSKYRVSFPI